MNISTFKKAVRASRIALSYEGPDEIPVYAGEETLRALLTAFYSTDDCDVILKSLYDKRKTHPFPAYIVAWDGKISSMWMWSQDKINQVGIEVRSEDGNFITRTAKLTDVISRADMYRYRAEITLDLPFGYYDGRVSINGHTHTFKIISAPVRFSDTPLNWGAFAPAYAIRSNDNQGIGGFAELGKAARIIGDMGGAFLGTLPLLPVSHEKADANSPYAPLSRFFWDEIYLDVNNLPCAENALLDFEDLNTTSLVDYPAVYRRKKEIIKKSAERFFGQYPDGDEAYKEFFATKSNLIEYAQSFDDPEYHLYAQYACHLQMKALRDNKNATLYLDYPVGVSQAGFDAQQFEHLFLNGFSVGAPPDKLGPKGQNWGFAPTNPAALIQDRFKYFRNSIRHYFHYAKMLRIDHVMGLYRLYCIPAGEESSQGAYIYYPFDAFMAILLLEAHLHNGIVIGENLGTVPDKVNDAMEKHRMPRMWVAPFETRETPDATYDTIEKDMIASLNTHDMFPFSSSSNNDDLEQLMQLGILSQDDVSAVKNEREKNLVSWPAEELTYSSIVEKMARSPARFVIINMEDMWDEKMPQNVPGTVSEYPNWRRKFSMEIEKWSANSTFVDTAAILNKYRGNA